jgi:DNA-binding transcriptional LysR family regulator
VAVRIGSAIGRVHAGFSNRYRRPTRQRRSWAAVLKTILLPKLLPVMHLYPDIRIEFDVSYGFRDIVADRFDAGVRLGESIDKDMIALPISPQLRMAAVASTAYFEKHPIPKVPGDLTQHNCINIRFPTSGGLYVWEFERRDRQVNVRVEGQATFNTSSYRFRCARRHRHRLPARGRICSPH